MNSSNASADEVKMLERLGLSQLQARIYITLSKLGASTVRELAFNAQVDRANIYRKLSKLQEKCLVEKIIDFPNRYRALPLKDALEILLNTKTEDYAKTKKIVEENIQQLKNNELKNNPQKELNQQFTLLPPKQGHNQIFLEVLQNAKISYDGIVCGSGFKRILYIEKENNIMGNLLKKGATIRTIVGNEKKKLVLDDETANVLKRLNENSAYQVRLISGLPEAVFAIIDKKEVFIHTKPAPDWVGTPSLRSNNVSLLSIIQKYFDQTWLQAKTLSFKTKPNSSN